MNDRELPELAANAYLDKSWHGNEAYMCGFMATWNPLVDDGDALRLAARLEIDVWHGKWPSGEKYAAAHKVWCPNDSMFYDDGIAYKNDKEAATRRAAAEIGKAMK